MNNKLWPSQAIIAVVLLLLSTSAFGALRIGSWNLLHLGFQNDKNLQAVAAVAAQFDLLAVQELMSPEALTRLDKALEAYTGVTWKHLSSEAEGRTSYREHYGFVWRTDKATYAGGAASYVDERDKFAREPFSATFKRQDTGQVIALATVHIRYGESQADRRPEIRALGRYWQWFAALYPNVQLYVLTGDMNMAPDDPGWQVLDKSAHGLITRGKTTLSTTPGQYASLYDQIFVPDTWTSQAGATAGIFEYPKAYRWGWSVRDHISDHLPVYLLLGEDQFTLRTFGTDLGTLIAAAPDNASRGCIRLNAASAERLDALPHIGPARAKDIIEGRPWKSVMALVAIRGIGNARAEDIAASGLVCTPVKVP